ncbi:MAG: GtrA family protein [Gammaproteobacteria bacterium]|nr:GtrA family protein [Gammaproteobacteria bacterium]
MQRFLLFVIAGLLAAGSHYGLMATLILLLGTAPVLASSAGVVLATLVAFLFNHLVTFADADGGWRQNGPRWLLVACGVWCTNGLMLKSLLLLGMSIPFGQLLASLLAFVFSFSVNRRFTFRL